MAQISAAARARETTANLRRGTENFLRLLAAAGVRPVSLRMEARENTLRAWAVLRTGNLILRLNAAWGAETFFRAETETAGP